jgi:resuscitation-promoting factor RpfB
MPLPPPPKQSSLGSLAFDWAKGHRILSIGVALILVVGLLNALAGPTDAETSTGPSTTESPNATISPEPSPLPDPVTLKTKVPDVVGLQLKTARARVLGHDLDVSVEKRFSHEAAGAVLRQSLRAGDRVEEGTTISLFVAKAFPRVPTLNGLSQGNAKKRLTNAGYDVVVRLQETSSVSAGTVISSTPAAGVEVRPGAKITLVVAKAPPAPPPPAPSGSNCHPSYSGACLDPNASDYDCAGGTGDGPKYTGYVTVVGPDVFGLDSDGDGAGCES